MVSKHFVKLCFVLAPSDTSLSTKQGIKGSAINPFHNKLINFKSVMCSQLYAGLLNALGH